MGHLKHGGVHLLHSRGRLAHTVSLTGGPVIGVVDKAGKIISGGVERLHHSLKLACGVQHTFNLGFFGFFLGCLSL